MRKLALLALMLTLTACSAKGSGSTALPLPSDPGAVVTAPASLPAALANGTQAVPLVTSGGLQFTSADLVFTLSSPADDLVVSTPSVAFTGATNKETVLSVNDAIHVLPAAQPFSFDVALKAGANILGVVASDEAGNSIEFVLVITYEPSEE